MKTFKPDEMPQTRIEEDYGHKFSDAEWATIARLEYVANDLADMCCKAINKAAARIPREPLGHNEQWTLEKLIAILESRV